MTIGPLDVASCLDPLSKLAIRHGSDKFGAHLYTPHYDEILSGLRNGPVRLLEIGVGGYDTKEAGGSSLRMWADYFPHGTIVGLDFYEKLLDLPPHVVIERGSQDDKLVLDRLSQRHGPFDVIIDDGSHDPNQIVVTFCYLYPRLSEGGFYIIEDTQLAFRPETGGDNLARGTIFELGHAIALAMHVAEGHHPANEMAAAFGRITKSVTTIRNAIIFARGSNAYPSNLAFDMNSPEVGAIYEMITREADAHPGPRSILSRIDMNIWGHRGEEAEALALSAASTHPHDAGLLAELERMMHWAHRLEAARSIRELREKRPPAKASPR